MNFISKIFDNSVFNSPNCQSNSSMYSPTVQLCYWDRLVFLLNSPKLHIDFVHVVVCAAMNTISCRQLRELNPSLVMGCHRAVELSHLGPSHVRWERLESETSPIESSHWVYRLCHVIVPVNNIDPNQN